VRRNELQLKSTLWGGRRVESGGRNKGAKERAENEWLLDEQKKINQP